MGDDDVLKSRSVSITNAQERRCIEIGGNNFSLGVRKALEHYFAALDAPRTAVSIPADAEVRVIATVAYQSARWFRRLGGIGRGIQDFDLGSTPIHQRAVEMGLAALGDLPPDPLDPKSPRPAREDVQLFVDAFVLVAREAESREQIGTYPPWCAPLRAVRPPLSSFDAWEWLEYRTEEFKTVHGILKVQGFNDHSTTYLVSEVAQRMWLYLMGQVTPQDGLRETFFRFREHHGML